MNEWRGQPETSVPVCIAGMHRSGTSTVAQLLYRCGLHLGGKEQLRGARADNPTGYWEHREIAAINEQVLKAYGGGWDLPPPLKNGWQEDARLDSLKNAADLIIKDFEGHEPWGWKDPRNSLTLPFWKSLLPEIKVIVCLRNPLEVAHSLHKRGYSSYAFGFNLWLTYYERLLDELQDSQYVVTHYDAYFRRPRVHLRRVLDFLELSASEKTITQACSATLKKNLHHHNFTTHQLLKSEAPANLKDLYLKLCTEANWGHKAALPSE